MDFMYNGQNYTTDVDVSIIRGTNAFIKLPDNRLLKVTAWTETFPCQPMQVSEVKNIKFSANDYIALARFA